jgi:maltokinase
MTDVTSAVAAGDLSFLDPQAFNEWIVQQRWFASKTREVSQIDVVDCVALRTESPLIVLCLVEARFPSGTHETYQVPLGLRPASEGWSERVVLEVDGWTVYDALSDPAAGRELLHRMRQNSELQVEQDEFIFRWAPSAGYALGGTVDVRPVGVEQSNSSIVFGDELIMKAFRRVEPGVNPELELLRFLSARGFPHIASLAGWYEVEGRQVSATLGILQEFLLGFRDGWELALDELASDPEGLLAKLEALGVVIGELHTALGSDNSDPAFAPDEPSVESLSILTADVDEQIERLFLDLPETEATAPLSGRGQDVREKLHALSHVNAGGRVIRTHGDLHLGQTMLGDRGWVVLDFEGEPARPLPERRLKRSPLRDVAGMLRSFSYVTAGASILRGVQAPDGWEARARDAFLEGYYRAVDGGLLPPGQQATDQLLAVFELEKAVYELRYELNNRPDWVAIPVAGIVRLLEAE